MNATSSNNFEKGQGHCGCNRGRNFFHIHDAPNNPSNFKTNFTWHQEKMRDSNNKNTELFVLDVAIIDIGHAFVVPQDILLISIKPQ